MHIVKITTTAEQYIAVSASDEAEAIRYVAAVDRCGSIPFPGKEDFARRDYLIMRTAKK